MHVSRRSFILAAALSLVGGDALAARRHSKRRGSSRRGKAGASAPIAAPKLTGTPVPIPPLVEVKAGDSFDLKAAPARHAFLKDKPVDVSGYNGQHFGPTLRLARGQTVTARVTNGLTRPTNVHWHGLLVDSAADGALASVPPGGSWSASLKVDQPPATLWYHAHLHGSVGADVMDGLAGLLIIDDPDVPSGLPSAYGIDDFPVILQDATFDDAGRPVYHPTGEEIGHGFRGKTVTVNGVSTALLTVPQRLVRLRLLNAAMSRTFRLYLEDERSFYLVATDGGYLARPTQIDTLTIAPGERAEILIDFADGSTSLMSTPDDHQHRMGDHVMKVADTFASPFRVLAMNAEKDSRPAQPLPEALPTPVLAAVPATPVRRRFVLEMASTRPGGAAAAPMTHAMAGHDMAAHGAPMPAVPAALPPASTPAPAPASGKQDMVKSDKGPPKSAAVPGQSAAPPAADDTGPRLTINGRTFAMGRIDETIPFGSTEIWEIVTPQMAHAFHVHGVHFRVLSEEGGAPSAWNRGLKDTIYVENNAEILITFNRRAGKDAPFLYHCHMLEHEDHGMMGTFTVG